MTTEAHQSPENAPESSAPVSTDDDPKGMRKIISDQAEEIRMLKAEKRDVIITELGLDPNIQMGKMLAEKFDRGEVTLDNLTTVAVEEYGIVPPAPAEELHPQAQQVAQEQARLDQAGITAGSVAVPTENQQLEAAEQSGDVQTTMRIKADQLAAMFPGNHGRSPNA